MNLSDIAGLRTATDLQSASAAASVDSGEELGKTAFLELMIAQINNQNPLDPAKNEEFVAQLAQFSSVEGIQNLNESMADMATSIKASMTLNAASIVGRSVMATSNLASMNGGGLIGNVNVSDSVSNLQVQVSSPGGEPLSVIDLGAQQAGTIRFAWDGKNGAGEEMPAGFYRIHAYSDVGGEAVEYEVEVPDRVISVSLGAEGATANLASGGNIPVAQITEIQ